MPLITTRADLRKECFQYAVQLEMKTLIDIVGEPEAKAIKSNRNSTIPFSSCKTPLETFEAIYSHFMTRYDSTPDEGKTTGVLIDTVPIYNVNGDWQGYISMKHAKKMRDDDEKMMASFWAEDIFVPDILENGIEAYRLHVNNHLKKYYKEISYVRSKLLEAMAANRMGTELAQHLVASITFRGKRCFDELIENPALIPHVPV